MTAGGSIFLIALGAILTFAVDAEVAGVDLDVVGVILMVVGLAGALWAAVAGRRTREVVHEHRS